MKLSGVLSLVSLAFASQAQAASIAVIDSGTDYKHKDLAAKIWNNADETKDNSKDDDSNGYVDDIIGWNFAESNNQVIDYKYLNTFSADCYKFFEIQGKILLGTATEEDKKWYQSKRDDQTFIQELSKFGNFIHGTHVAGISAAGNDAAKIMALKLIPTETTPGAAARFRETFAPSLDEEDPMSDMMVKFFLDMLAGQQGKLLAPVGKYVGDEKADVANGSFGTSVGAVKPIIAGLLQTLLGREPTEEETEKYAVYFVEKIVEGAKEFVDGAKDTLFVFAAGNDGGDNDKHPASPANVKTDNTIAVAATIGFEKLASFSNTGAEKVEVAAPGVVIKAPIPGDKHMEMSGTSMAAPFVTNAAALVKDANPALKPAQVKKILIETVDVKDFLKDKVKSSGIVNPERAKRAAELSRDKALDAAIAEAKSGVEDMVSELAFLPTIDESELFVTPLPSPFR